MISVWPSFTSTPSITEFEQKAGFIPGCRTVSDWIGRGYISSFYDAFSPGAGAVLEQMQEHLYVKASTLVDGCFGAGHPV